MVKTDAFAMTKAGKLQGVCIDGVYRFLGVRYAQSTAGKNRFMPPQPLIPWEGVKPALSYAGKCWQTDTPRMEDEEIRSTKYPWNYEKMCEGTNVMGSGFQSEDCLAVNIWTNGLRDDRKRPVMVWFHGGGNIAGAAEANWHDGYNLAKKQDVVLVSVGHRLGIFGYMYLADFGNDKFTHANVGHQDMVAALKWINENIEEFGGDPDNVTLFGQSGGGGKVAALMAMPSAKGLFHKAIIQSGGFNASPPEVGTMYAQQLLDYLKIDKDHLEDLQDIPPEDLIQASREINKTRTVGTYFQTPVINDGEILKYDPFDGAEGSEFCKDIILITGYTKDDRRLSALFEPSIFTYTHEELPDRIAEMEGCSKDEANEIIAMYKRILGDDCTACDIYTSLINDKGHLMATENRYKARAKVGSAPTYSYVLCFESKDEDMKAIHGVDVPFFFDNAIYAPGIWNADTRVGAMKLSEAAGAAWANFARTGNPSNPGMPAWKPFDDVNRYTMLIDVESKLVSDYRKEAREYITRSTK